MPTGTEPLRAESSSGMTLTVYLTSSQALLILVREHSGCHLEESVCACDWIHSLAVFRTGEKNSLFMDFTLVVSQFRQGLWMTFRKCSPLDDMGI